MDMGEPAEDGFSAAGDANANTPPIVGVRVPRDQSLGHETIDEPDRTVVFDVKTLGEAADGRRQLRRQPFQRQQQLMLARVEPGRTRRAFAERQKAADLIAEFGQRLIVGITRSGQSVKYIV